MEINVKRRGKYFMVGFNHEGQYFTLDYKVKSKDEAEWMKDMLSKCFDRANADLYRLIQLSTKENEATWANEGCLFGLTEKEFEEYQHLLEKYKNTTGG